MSAAVASPRIFAQSESQTVGFAGRAMQMLRDNAPRVVGGMKLAGDLTVGLTLDPFFLGYTAFATMGRLMLLAFGTKANQQKQAAQAHEIVTDDSWVGNCKKIIQPRHYPVEASAGVSTIAEMFGVAAGINKFVGGQSGYTPLLLGLVATWSYANILFGKEKKKDAAPAPESESLTFASSQSREVGWMGKLKSLFKDNPVAVSSAVQLGISLSMFIGGIMEYESLGLAYVVAGAIFTLACLTQTLLVRKNEFNVEGAAQSPPADPSFAARYTASRDSAMDLPHDRPARA